MAFQIGINKVFLCGRAAADCVFSHETRGERFFIVPIETVRLSGQSDIANLIISEAKLPETEIKKDSKIKASGQLRSYNNKSGVGNRLVISVFVTEIEAGEDQNENTVELSGILCKAPVFRKTPLGREICDLMLAVKRKCGRTDYLPCIAWGIQARECSGLNLGDSIRLKGRFQSRIYIKRTLEGEDEKTAFEVSIMSLLPLEEETQNCKNEPEIT